MTGTPFSARCRASKVNWRWLPARYCGPPTTTTTPRAAGAAGRLSTPSSVSLPQENDRRRHLGMELVAGDLQGHSAAQGVTERRDLCLRAACSQHLRCEPQAQELVKELLAAAHRLPEQKTIDPARPVGGDLRGK